MNHGVRAKKSLGQHFLKNDDICKRIAESLTFHQGYKHLLEIGPGTGALTQHLLPLPVDLHVIEIDRESVAWLNAHFPALHGKIHEEDFLRFDPATLFQTPFAIIGNFPYNISSQILFKALEHRDSIPEIVGMFQREVAQRIASGPGNKDYGILSVLMQTWYKIEYLFTVDENEFIPPPKVKSGVIRIRRNEQLQLRCDEKKLIQVVKTAFNQRRKTLRNSLKSLSDGRVDMSAALFSKRPEQLGVEEFIDITLMFDKK